MHGRPRKQPGEKQDPEKLKAKEKKTQQFKQLTNAVIEGVGAGRSDPEFLAMSAQLLQNNPDVYTVWNHRRKALQDVLKGEDRAAAREVAAAELKVTENALLENPKSYSAWHHRLWIIRLQLLPLHEELQQVERFLKMDSRNFHAWHYRREVGRLAGVDPQAELQHTRDLIDANFSNYSAWHARSSLLREAHATQQVVSIQDLLSAKPDATAGKRQEVGIPPEELEGEFELVRQAFFTDPEDQSAYFYHCWLLTACMAHCQAAVGTPSEHSASQSVAEVLRREEASCRELIDIETDRFRLKWPLLTLCLLLKLQSKLGVPTSDEGEVGSLYQQLIEVDPLRKGFYQEAASLDSV